jgi:hypothetical protein
VKRQVLEIRCRLEFIQQAFTVRSVFNSFMSFNKVCGCRKLKCVNAETKLVTDRNSSAVGIGPPLSP